MLFLQLPVKRGQILFWWDLVEKELVFAGNSCKNKFLEKYLKKQNMESNSYFLQELGRNSLEFLELGGKEKE
jgi:hypothetical protein